MKLKSAATAAALLGLCASSAQATEPQLIGSDTLDSVMKLVFGPTGYNFPESVIVYNPAGSGPGENAIVADVQEWAPMSRFLSRTGVLGCNDPQVDNSKAGCWRIADDLVSVVANNPESNAPGAATCNQLRISGNMTVTDANGDGTTEAGGSYAFSDWRSVLRIIYAGVDTNGVPPAALAPIATRCNSDVRLSLVNNWSNLFEGGCASGNCATGLKHAFRRDDVSGTTAVFLSLLQLPAITTTPRPFCNGDETQDADPVRRALAGDGFLNAAGTQTICGVTSATAGEDTVSGVGAAPSVRNANGALGVGSLGLVQPLLIAGIADAYTAQGTGNGAKNCSALGGTGGGGGGFGRVAWNTQDVLRYGAKCPNGAAQVGGTCQWPKPPGAGGEGPGFGCIANANSRPIDTVGGQGAASGFDARVYNLWARNSDGTVKTYPRTVSGAISQQRAFVSYFKQRQHHCRELDETDSIGCFVRDDHCNIGFGGLRAETDCSINSLAINGIAATPANVATYPLARPLYICQIDGFGTSPGTQSTAFLADQQIVHNALINNDQSKIGPAVSAGGFLNVSTFTKTCCVGAWAGTGSDVCN